MLKAKAAVAIGVTGLLALAGVSVAQEEKPTGIVKYRQHVMQTQAQHLQALQTLLTTPNMLADDKQRQVQASTHAAAVATSTDWVPDLFPDGSTQASKALPTVWSDKAGFEKASERASELADKLSNAVRSGDQQAALAALGALGKEGCSGCHDNFRKKPAT